MVAIISELFGGRMRTKVGFPPNSWKHCDIPQEDAISMNLVYSRRLSVNQHITPREFLVNVSERLRTEWSLKEGCNKQSSDYQGEGFTDFIRDETHYELERAGYIWHTETGCFRRLTADTYTLMRKSVLAGFVRHAVEFFEKNDAAWESFLSTDEGMTFLQTNVVREDTRWKYLPPQDPRNLRGSLESFILRCS